MRRLTRRRAIVNLATGTVFDGILFRRTRRLLVLKSSKMLLDQGAPVPEGREGKPVDGDVVVERSEVEFVQYPGGVG